MRGRINPFLTLDILDLATSMDKQKILAVKNVSNDKHQRLIVKQAYQPTVKLSIHAVKTIMDTSPQGHLVLPHNILIH